MLLPADFTFDEAAHVYRVGGVRWPSVTQILEPLQAQSFKNVPRDVLEAAAAFGTHVHAACHLDNQGILHEATLDPALLPYLKAWRQFQIDTDAVIVASEMRVAHPRLRYCGTLDTICRIRGTRELVDIKSTALIPPTVGIQTAAYAEALGESNIRRRVVQLRSDGTYRSAPLRERSDWNLFLGELNRARWLDANYFQHGDDRG